MDKDIQQAMALEIAKMKMLDTYKQDPRIGMNTDLWVDEFHTALNKIMESERNYAKDNKQKVKNRHSDF